MMANPAPLLLKLKEDKRAIVAAAPGRAEPRMAREDSVKVKRSTCRRTPDIMAATALSGMRLTVWMFWCCSPSVALDQCVVL